MTQEKILSYKYIKDFKKKKKFSKSKLDTFEKKLSNLYLHDLNILKEVIDNLTEKNKNKKDLFFTILATEHSTFFQMNLDFVEVYRKNGRLNIKKLAKIKARLCRINIEQKQKLLEREFLMKEKT